MTPDELLAFSGAKRIPVYFLWRAIWRWVFDEFRCPYSHRSEIEKEILAWNNIITEQKRIRLEKFGPQWQTTAPVGEKGNHIDELEYQIGMMCKVLVENEAGGWEYHKDTLRVHGIDYRQSIHCNQWFPECQDPKRFERGQAHLKQAMIDHPEDYRPDKNKEV